MRFHNMKYKNKKHFKISQGLIDDLRVMHGINIRKEILDFAKFEKIVLDYKDVSLIREGQYTSEDLEYWGPQTLGILLDTGMVHIVRIDGNDKDMIVTKEQFCERYFLELL